MAANAGRYPVSAQCEILGVPRSTYYAMRGRAEPAEAPDPAAEEVAWAFEESRGRYGSRKIKASLARRGVVLATGGYARNEEFRAAFMPRPTPAHSIIGAGSITRSRATRPPPLRARRQA